MLKSNCTFASNLLMKLLRLLLFPFSLLYGLGVILRNLAYDTGILKSEKFDRTVISIGNLSAGGSGKSPMTEYLVRLLKENYRTATLSRGYGRNSSGFLLVDAGDMSTQTGDEPLQFKKKFTDITVAVCEDRIEGIKRLEKNHDMIILDDAFQHRAVKPALSILLFEYASFFQFQCLLPTGNLREPMSGIKRARLIVISKCPRDIRPEEKQAISRKLNLNDQQTLFFSYLKYGNLMPLNENKPVRALNSLNMNSQIVLLTGIANAGSLLTELHLRTAQIIHHQYPDHHKFSLKNIIKLVETFNELSAGDNLIITTEKDVQRLDLGNTREKLKNLPVYYLPVETEFHEPGKSLFNNLIKTYASESALNN